MLRYLLHVTSFGKLTWDSFEIEDELGWGRKTCRCSAEPVLLLDGLYADTIGLLFFQECKGVLNYQTEVRNSIDGSIWCTSDPSDFSYHGSYSCHLPWEKLRLAGATEYSRTVCGNKYGLWYLS